MEIAKVVSGGKRIEDFSKAP